LRRALQKYIEDPLSEALIQGLLPKPAELDIYLGEMGIFYRLANQPEPVAVAAGEGEPEAEPAPSPGIQLYTF
jgi:ATP-dependent Clp protease ATP-binding subunit ClpC